jgi:hypothetical protein
VTHRPDSAKFGGTPTSHLRSVARPWGQIIITSTVASPMCDAARVAQP